MRFCYGLILSLFYLSSCGTWHKPKKKENDGWFFKNQPFIVKSFSRLDKVDLSNNKYKSYIGDKYEQLDRFVRPKLDPYTGDLLTFDKCLKKNLPKKNILEDSESYLLTVHLYSSNINSVGQCYSDKGLYKTSYNYLFCKKSKKLFKIKYFYKDEFKWVTQRVVFCD